MKYKYHIYILAFSLLLLFSKKAHATSIEILSPAEGATIAPSELVEIKWRESEPLNRFIIRLCEYDANNSITSCYGIAEGDAPQVNQDGTKSFYYYNNKDYSEKKDRIFIISSPSNTGLSAQVKVSLLPGVSIKSPQSVKDALINVLPFESDSRIFTDIILIKWEQRHLSQPVSIDIKDEQGRQIAGFPGPAIDDGVKVFNLKIGNTLMKKDGTKYKVRISSKYKFTGIREGNLSDSGDEFFTLAEQNSAKEFFSINNIKVSKKSFLNGDSGIVTWSSECKAPFVDILLVKENISGKEDFIYLTPWAEGHAQYPNSIFSKNVGSYSFRTPNAFSFKSMNKSYSFSYRLTDGATITTTSNSEATSLEPGTYRIRVVVHKYGPSQVMFSKNKLEDISSYQNCIGTGLSEPFYIGKEASISDEQGAGVGVNTNSGKNKSLITKLSGKILLQVESRGEAWYLSPKDEKRYYMADGASAFNIMRNLGVGISNRDLNKIPVAKGYNNNLAKLDSDNDGYNDKLELESGYNPYGAGKLVIDKSFSSKNQGKIFLQVESRGEAWYVSPSDGLRYYLGTPEDAFNIMRNLGLGVTNDNLNKIAAHQ